jgi:xanthine dehydrogenase large subunit
VASLGDYRHQPKIDAPATPERVLWGCEQMRQLTAAKAVETETELASL